MRSGDPLLHWAACFVRAFRAPAPLNLSISGQTDKAPLSIRLISAAKGLLRNLQERLNLIERPFFRGGKCRAQGVLVGSQLVVSCTCECNAPTTLPKKD